MWTTWVREGVVRRGVPLRHLPRLLHLSVNLVQSCVLLKVLFQSPRLSTLKTGYFLPECWLFYLWTPSKGGGEVVEFVCWLVGCLTSQQHASVSQGRICSDNFTCCHTETEVADQSFHLTQPQYTDTWPTSPSTDPIMPGAWQGSHWSANF